MLLVRKYSKCWFICFRSDFCVGWLISNCHWSPAKRIVSFHVPTVVNSFCHTSAAKMVSSLEMFTGPQRNDDLSFTSQVRCATFAIGLQRKRYLACNWSLVCSETITFLKKNGGDVFLLYVCSETDANSVIYLCFGVNLDAAMEYSIICNDSWSIWKPKIPKGCLWDSWGIPYDLELDERAYEWTTEQGLHVAGATLQIVLKP